MNLVAEIEKLLLQGELSQRQIAKKLGTNQSKVSRIAAKMDQIESVNQNESNSSESVNQSVAPVSLAKLLSEECEAVRRLAARLAVGCYPYRYIQQAIESEHQVTLDVSSVHALVHESDLLELRSQVVSQVVGGVPDVPLASVGVRQAECQELFEQHRQAAEEAKTEREQILPELDAVRTALAAAREEYRAESSAELEQRIKFLAAECRDIERTLVRAQNRECRAYSDMLRTIELADRSMSGWVALQIKKQETEAALAELRGEEPESEEQQWIAIEDNHRELIDREADAGNIERLISGGDAGWRDD